MKKYWPLMAIVSLGCLILFPLIIFSITISVVGSALGMQSNSYFSGSFSVETIGYQSIIERYCKENQIVDYVPLVMAVMQQESGGSGGDPMQCSESPYNLKYPNTPGGITDPEYSIEIGVSYLASCIRAAQVKSPEDIAGISLALQGYNFGGGYINWAMNQGGYSKQNAVAFSQMKAQKLGWNGYGDVNYVSNVLRYYAYINTEDNGLFNYPMMPGTYTISSGYGYRWGKLHKGMDFTASEGTKIYVSASGTVVFSGLGTSENGYNGYGYVLLVKHNESYSTLYAHCSQLLVPAGSIVTQGSPIALVGNTGDSTGAHLHFEIRKDNVAIDPAKYFLKSL